MLDKLTPEVIASAIVGLVFAFSGFGIYARTRGGHNQLHGAYKVEKEENAIAEQLERIAQGVEDLVAANKDSFQREARDQLERLEEAVVRLAEDKRRQGGRERDDR